MCDTDISSDNDSTDETLLDINDRDALADASNYLLPEKSKKQYDKAYQDFMRWKMSKSIQSFNEEVLVEYFQILSEKFKSSSLYTFYSMLKCTLSLKHEVEISKYSKLQALLKTLSEGYQVKKSKTFSPKEINKFLTEAHDRDYLLIKIALIFGIVGACQRQELYRLKFKDVEVYGSRILVKVHKPSSKHPRTFDVTGSYFELCKKYISLRPDPCSNTYFFLLYKAGKCSSQNVGINNFGKLGKTIASYLELPNPELYTGHCFRRTSNIIAHDAHADEDILPLKRHCRWNNPSKTEVPYIVDGIIHQKLKCHDTSKTEVPYRITDSSESNSNQVINTNFPNTTATENCSNSPVQNNYHENKSIECVNINIPSKEAEVCMNDSMDTQDQVWNDIQNCFQNKRDININIPGSTLSDGYTSDYAVIGNKSEFVNLNIPNPSVSEGFIDDSTKNNDPVGNPKGNTIEEGSNRVVNINILGTSHLQQSLSALVRFSNCNIQNVNIYYPNN